MFLITCNSKMTKLQNPVGSRSWCIWPLSFNLSRFATTIQAQIYAIEMYPWALLKNGFVHKSIELFSDSQAALGALGFYRFNSTVCLRAIFCLVFLVQLLSSQNIELNNRCDYSSHRVTLTCSNLIHLHRMDLFLAPATKILILTNNSELIFPRFFHLTRNYRHLSMYTITKTDTLEIHEYAFQGLDELYFLKITDNNLPVLKNHTFAGLNSLEFLNIGDNNIDEVESLAFSGLTSLISLEMNQNNIKVLKTLMFKDLTNLIKLFIEGNNIETIEEDAFYGLENLDLLDLSGNSIKTIVGEQTSHMPKLEFLSVNFNKIEKIEGVLNLPNLKYLHIQSNRIEYLEETVFKNASGLLEIDISHNNIKNISDDHFLHLRNLTLLRVQGNNLDLENTFRDLKNFVVIIQ